MSLITEIENTHIEFTALRRDIHAHPELAFQENRTSDVVAERLTAWGIEVHRGLGKTGVVGVLRGTRTAATGTPRAIGVRADMDALPMPEHNRFAHASQNPGRMHGCGHDGHTAMLLGAAKYLAAHRDFDGIVNFIFQPAEEGGNAGARAMMQDGLFEKFPCDEIYGIHNMPGYPVGHFAFRKGPTMASSNRFDIIVRGTGGHAAQPHKAVDTIVIAAEMVGVLQTLISRHKNPIDVAVVSVTQIHAGDAYNVLPGEAVIRGTVRTFSTQVLDDIEANMRRVAEEYHFPFPYLYDETQLVARRYGAVCTPDFFGYNAELKLQYRGRLRHSRHGVLRPDATTQDRDAGPAWDQGLPLGRIG